MRFTECRMHFDPHQDLQTGVSTFHPVIDRLAKLS